jgi:hypothetical protein
MRGWQTRHGEICAGGAHLIAKTIAVDVVHLIEVAVNEQNWLRQAAAIGRLASIGDVGVVADVPRAGSAETMSFEPLVIVSKSSGAWSVNSSRVFVGTLIPKAFC